MVKIYTIQTEDKMNHLRMIDTITQTYVSLNEISDDFDPELENRRAELFLELSKSMMLIFGMEQDHEKIVNKMVHYVENCQFFNVQQDVLRPLLCDENMEINALRVLLFSLARSLKEREEGDLDSVDETYYESDDVIYMRKEDVNIESDDEKE
jgi:hypothetical protein